MYLIVDPDVKVPQQFMSSQQMRWINEAVRSKNHLKHDLNGDFSRCAEAQTIFNELCDHYNSFPMEIAFLTKDTLIHDATVCKTVLRIMMPQGHVYLEFLGNNPEIVGNVNAIYVNPKSTKPKITNSSNIHADADAFKMTEFDPEAQWFRFVSAKTLSRNFRLRTN